MLRSFANIISKRLFLAARVHERELQFFIFNNRYPSSLIPTELLHISTLCRLPPEQSGPKTGNHSWTLHYVMCDYTLWSQLLLEKLVAFFLSVYFRSHGPRRRRFANLCGHPLSRGHRIPPQKRAIPGLYRDGNGGGSHSWPHFLLSFIQRSRLRMHILLFCRFYNRVWLWLSMFHAQST